MLPTLFSIGSFTVSSFGVFLTLGFLFGIFLIWRLSRAWDLNEEKILDLTLLTIIGGLVGARAYFVFNHLTSFTSILKILIFTKYPGFSFWGAFLGGWLSLYYFAGRQKLDFWLVADIAAVGFLGSLIFSDLGCFLGSCGVGSQTRSFLGVSMVGLIGKRWPIQLFEAVMFGAALMKVWSQAIRFHQRGKIVSISLIIIGAVKLILKPFQVFSDDYIFSSLILLLGVVIFYKITKKNILNDLKSFFKLCLSPKLVIGTIKKAWYNQIIIIAWRFRSFKKLLRRINVRFSHKNNQP